MILVLAACGPKAAEEAVEDWVCPTEAELAAELAESARTWAEARDAALAAQGLALADLGPPRERPPGPFGPRAATGPPDVPLREFGLRGDGASRVLVGPVSGVPCGGAAPDQAVARAPDGALVPVLWRYGAPLPTVWACGCGSVPGCGAAPRDLRPEWRVPADATLRAPVVVEVPDDRGVLRYWSAGPCDDVPAP